MSDELDEAHQQIQLLISERDRARAERDDLKHVVSNMEAALRGVHGMQFADGYEVNVAALQEDLELAKAERDDWKGRYETCRRHAVAHLEVTEAAPPSVPCPKCGAHMVRSDLIGWLRCPACGEDYELPYGDGSEMKPPPE